MNDDCWTGLLKAIAAHPSLLTLTFEDIDWEGYNGPEAHKPAKLERTKNVAHMLLANERIEEMRFDGFTFDHNLWDSLVAPRIEINLFRKRFVPLVTIGEPSTRAAVVAKVLSRVAQTPSLLYMVLSQNHDVLVEYLD